MKLKPIAFILLAALLGYAGYWFYIAQHTDVYLRTVLTDLAQNKGVIASYESFEVSGFPYRLVITFENPSVSYRNGPLHADLEATTMEAVLQPWNLNHVILFPQEATFRVGFGAGQENEITLRPSVFELSVSKSRSDTYRMSSEMEEVAASSTFESLVPARLSEVAFHLRKFTVESGNAEGQLFEPKILEMALIAGHPDGGLFEAEVSLRGEQVPRVERADLARWRDQGGTFEIDHFEVATGKARATGSGSLSLDQDFRLLGAVDLKGVLMPEVVAFFRARGWLSAEQAQAVSAFFASLPPEAKDTPLALTAQDGYLMLGPVRFEAIGPVVPESD